MFLYRFEVTIDTRTVDVIIAATSEEKAFDQVEIEIERNYLKIPVIKEIVLYEKKRISNGTGFVLEKSE